MTIDKEILSKIHKFIEEYTQMDVRGIVINCPYWTNKMRKNRVVLRGFLDGKGDAFKIQQELIRRLNSVSVDSSLGLTPEYLRKFAKRERIGIDCSGFVYRALEELVRLKYEGCELSDLSEVFREGIKRTSANTLTLREFCLKVDKISDIRLGDVIRMMKGRHIAVILGLRNSQIIYAHSSNLTKVQGVHLGKIQIISKGKLLGDQKWLEKTKRGENFGEKYFNSERGDGVFRLKIFI